MRKRIAWRLHCWADRLDPHNAYRTTGLSFTFEVDRGAVLRRDGRGCPIYYPGRDAYARAHAESDTHPPSFFELLGMMPDA